MCGHIAAEKACPSNILRQSLLAMLRMAGALQGIRSQMESQHLTSSYWQLGASSQLQSRAAAWCLRMHPQASLQARLPECEYTCSSAPYTPTFGASVQCNIDSNKDACEQ